MVSLSPEVATPLITKGLKCEVIGRELEAGGDYVKCLGYL